MQPHQYSCTCPSESGVAPEAVAEAYHKYEQGGKVEPLKAAAMSNQGIQESMRLLLLVRAYQVWLAAITVSNLLRSRDLTWHNRQTFHSWPYR